jgi:hypothetical protein
MGSKQGILPAESEDGVFAAHQALARAMADQPSKPALKHKQRYPHPTHYLNEDGELSIVNRASVEHRFPVPPHPWLFLDYKGALQVIPGTSNAVALDPRYPLVRTSDLEASAVSLGSDRIPDVVPASNIGRLAPEGSRYMCIGCKKIIGEPQDPVSTGEFACPRCRTLAIQGFLDLPPLADEPSNPTSSRRDSPQRHPWALTPAQQRRLERELYVPTQKEITRRYKELLGMQYNGRLKFPTARNDGSDPRIPSSGSPGHAKAGPGTVSSTPSTIGLGPSGPQLSQAFITPPRQTGASSVNHPSTQSTSLGERIRNLLPTGIHKTSSPTTQPDFGRGVGEPPVDRKGKGKARQSPEPDVLYDGEGRLPPRQHPVRRRPHFEDFHALPLTSRWADLVKSTKRSTPEPCGIPGPSRAAGVIDSTGERDPRVLDARRFPLFVDRNPTVEEVPEQRAIYETPLPAVPKGASAHPKPTIRIDTSLDTSQLRTLLKTKLDQNDKPQTWPTTPTGRARGSSLSMIMESPLEEFAASLDLKDRSPETPAPEPEVYVIFVATKLKLALQPGWTESMSSVPVAPDAPILTTIYHLPKPDCKIYSFGVSKLKWYIPDNSALAVLHNSVHTIEDTVYKVVSAEPLTFGKLNSFFGIKNEALVYGTFAWVLKPKTVIPGNWRFEEVKRAVESYWHCEYEVSIPGVSVGKLWPAYIVEGATQGTHVVWEKW